MQRAAEQVTMQGEEDGNVPLIDASPSFRAPPAAAGLGFLPADVDHDEAPPPDEVGDDDSDVVVGDDDDDDFEFAFVIRDPETGPDITADEIFSNGQIRPIYPIFNRALLFADEDGDPRAPAPAGEEEEETTEAVRGTLRRLLIQDREENPGSASSASSSAAEELDGIPQETYCVWAPNSSASPSPSRCRKSNSTGSGSSLRWRLRDLVVGRSHSDGKEKFVFLAAEAKKGKGSAAAPENRKARAKATSVDVVTAHRIYYGKGGQAGSGAARRSFLPYKPDLVGFFANVNGITRTHTPF
ncbi:hypothetical protein Cni_G07961 [Canna indica]|uniref:Uncharacterized protein n=1 Tax=Canna indica TaxID=4628 RepID=A0AAQ3Q843_9LILI|nr:hypothetical protein Cni_G07961 [Canna indica]